MISLKNGPLNKSLFTQELELLAKCIIRVPEKIHFVIEQGVDSIPSLHSKIGDIDIDVSALFKKANHSHVALSESDSASFSNHSKFLTNISETPSPLTHAEFNAIQKYTSSYYVNINHFLVNKFSEIMDYSDQFNAYHTHKDQQIEIEQRGVDQNAAQDVIINTLMLASGLNKILPSLENDLSYRGEHHVTNDDIKHRIDIIEQGGGITDEATFMSTSSDITVSENFSTNSMIIFDGIYGKSIESLSAFPSEQEYLLLPSPLLWESHEERNGSHTFHVKVVNPLIDGKDDVSLDEINIFKDLQTWAKEQGVDSNFLTPHLVNQLTPLSDPLQLNDCIDCHQDTLLLPSAPSEINFTASNTTQPLMTPPIVIPIDSVATAHEAIM